jgi:hypothetical protein
MSNPKGQSTRRRLRPSSNAANLTAASEEFIARRASAGRPARKKPAKQFPEGCATNEQTTYVIMLAPKSGVSSVLLHSKITALKLSYCPPFNMERHTAKKNVGNQSFLPTVTSLYRLWEVDNVAQSRSSGLCNSVDLNELHSPLFRVVHRRRTPRPRGAAKPDGSPNKAGAWPAAQLRVPAPSRGIAVRTSGFRYRFTFGFFNKRKHYSH